jgi:hypothetical protein
MPHTTYGLLKAVRSHQIDSPRVKASLETGRPNACNLCHLDQTLEWASTWLSKWYGHPQAELSPEDRRVSAALLWLLKTPTCMTVFPLLPMRPRAPRIGLWPCPREIAGV